MNTITAMKLNNTKIDFVALEAVMKVTRVTLKDLAIQYGMKLGDVRNALVSNYGSRVMFMRGRAGGVRLK